MAPTAILWICGLVTVAVFAVMIHSIATFRRGSAEPGARPSALAEIIWAIVPIFIMVSSALPAVRMLAADRASSDDVLAAQSHQAQLFTTSAVSYNADRK
jgi:heme/copper-type cytochrome/quinol oxidase subunit 2